MIHQYKFLDYPFGQILALTDILNQVNGKPYWGPKKINRMLNCLFKQTKKGLIEIAKPDTPLDPKVFWKTENETWRQYIEKVLSTIEETINDKRFHVYIYAEHFATISIEDEDGTELTAWGPLTYEIPFIIKHGEEINLDD